MIQQTIVFKEKEYLHSLTLLQKLTPTTLTRMNELIEKIDDQKDFYFIENELDANYKETFLDLLNVKEFCNGQLASPVIDKQLIIDLVDSMTDLLCQLYEKICMIMEELSKANLPDEIKGRVELTLIQLKNLVSETLEI